MKKIIYFSMVFVAFISLYSCNNTDGKEANKQVIDTEVDVSENTILVYYFHGSIRCHTCISVDEDTHKYLKELFPEKMDKSEIVFKSIDIDKKESPELIEKYEIYGQTLLLIKGDKKVDLTQDAFQYVTTSPEKWKQIFEDNMKELIN